MTAASPRAREATVVTHAVAHEEAGQRRRLSVFFAVVVVVSALLSVLWPQTGPAPIHARVRTSLHYTADSFLALHALSQRLGYRTSQLRASYAKLPPAETATLLCLDPLSHEQLSETYRGAETGQPPLLWAWVRAGGHVLVTWPGMEVEYGKRPQAPAPPREDDVLTGLFAELPDVQWVPAQGKLVGLDDLREVRNPWPTASATDLELGAAYLRPRDGDQGPPHLQAFATPIPADCRTLLTLDGAPLVLERHLGGGRVWAASTPLLFSTLGLAHLRCGHAAVALLHAASDGGRRRIWFDEFVHGQRQTRGVWWFVAHGPLGYPVAAMLLVLAVLAWRGAVRLGPPTQDATVARRAKEEFAIGVAALVARAGHARAAATALLRSYQQDGERRDPEQMAQLAQLGQRLDTTPSFGDKDLVALAAAIDTIVTDKSSS